MREVPHRARELADRDRRPGPAQSLEVSAGFGVPDRHLEPEGGGLGVNAVGPADGQRVLVAERQHAERLLETLLALDQKIHRVSELEGGRGIPHIAGRQADVDEARVLADLLLEAGQ